jgi:hypothetical protein
MPTYNGDNPHNNNIVIDFIKKTVKFEPVKEHSLSFYYFMNVLIYTLFFTFNVGISCMMMFIMMIFTHFPFVYAFSATLWLFIIYGVTAPLLTFTLMGLPFWNKYWRKHYFPKFSALMAYSIRVLQFNFHFIFRKKIYPKDLKGNVFIIPTFGNVDLDYELHGDFAEHIEKIEVHNHYKKDKKTGQMKPRESRFYAVFTFNGIIKEGYMRLRYI